MKKEKTLLVVFFFLIVIVAVVVVVIKKRWDVFHVKKNQINSYLEGNGNTAYRSAIDTMNYAEINLLYDSLFNYVIPGIDPPADIMAKFGALCDKYKIFQG